MKQGTMVKVKLSGWVGIILTTNTNNNGTWHNVRTYNKATGTFVLTEFNETELEVFDAEV